MRWNCWMGGVSVVNLVHADDDAVILLDLALELKGALMDLVRLVAVLQGGNRPTLTVDLGDVVECGLLRAIGEALDVVRAGKGVDCVGDAALVGEYLLRAEGYLGGLLGREAEGLVT